MRFDLSRIGHLTLNYTLSVTAPFWTICEVTSSVLEFKAERASNRRDSTLARCSVRLMHLSFPPRAKGYQWSCLRRWLRDYRSYQLVSEALPRPCRRDPLGGSVRRAIAESLLMRC